MPLTTSVLHDDGLALLALAGELDLAVVSRVDEAVAQVLADGLQLLVVDLGHLTFCDSSGLGALVRCQRAVRDAGGTVLFAGVTGPVAVLLRLTSMQVVLELRPDVSAALAELRHLAGAANGGAQIE